VNIYHTVLTGPTVPIATINNDITNNNLDDARRGIDALIGGLVNDSAWILPRFCLDKVSGKNSLLYHHE